MAMIFPLLSQLNASILKENNGPASARRSYAMKQDTKASEIERTGASYALTEQDLSSVAGGSSDGSEGEQRFCKRCGKFTTHHRLLDGGYQCEECQFVAYAK